MASSGVSANGEGKGRTLYDPAYNNNTSVNRGGGGRSNYQMDDFSVYSHVHVSKTLRFPPSRENPIDLSPKGQEINDPKRE